MTTYHHSTATPVQENDVIDIGQVATALGRQFKVIGIITTVAVLLSGFYAFTRKPVWEGQFEIVLENSDSEGGFASQLSALNPSLSNLTGGSSNKSALATEVLILESPSVLRPTFEFVRAYKSSAMEDVNAWKYTDWAKSSVEIELVQGTSVLTVSYRDTDRDLILPVLERISQTYQEYSGKDRRRGLTKGIDYIEQEIEKLRPQSTTSMREAQAYALLNGLGIQDGMSTGSGSSAGGSVEASREQAQNKVNSLIQRISAAQTSGNVALYKAPQISANSEMYGQLQEIETRLQQKLALLTPQDQSIQRLRRERQGMIAYINQQTIGLLQGELITAKAQLASLTRPRDVVLKHRELVRKAIRDEKILTDLEDRLQSLKLDQARKTEPWELISTPNVLDVPIGPRKKRMVALGSLGGFVLACCAALIRDRQSGLVFSEDELKSLLPCPMLDRIPARAPEKWSASAQLITQGLLSNSQSLALIPVGSLPKSQIDQLKQALQESLGSRQLLVTSDLLESRNSNTQILVTALGACQRQKLKQLKEQLVLQGTPIAGWLLIDSSQTSEV